MTSARLATAADFLATAADLVVIVSDQLAMAVDRLVTPADLGVLVPAGGVAGWGGFIVALIQAAAYRTSTGSVVAEYDSPLRSVIVTLAAKRGCSSGRFFRSRV